MQAIRHTLIITSVTQTGDMYQIAEALALDNNTDVLLLDRENNSEGFRSLHKQVEDFYRHAVRKTASPEQRERILILPLAKEVGFVNTLLTTPIEDKTNPAARFMDDRMSTIIKAREKAKAKEDRNEKNVKANAERNAAWQKFLDFHNKEVTPEKIDYHCISPTVVTQKLAHVFDAPAQATGIYKKIAENLSNGPYNFGNPDSVPKFAGKNLVSRTDPRKVLLLWSRFSGQNDPNGYNPAGDSDETGQDQLLEIAKHKDLDFAVITLGDDTRQGKDPESDDTCYIGKFFQQQDIKDGGRAEQMSFLLGLKDLYPGRLYQMGQKSGVLDAGALLGIPTLYLEVDSRNEFARMKAWVNGYEKGYTSGVPFYLDADLQSPPSALGKLMREFKEVTRGTKDPRTKKFSPANKELQHRLIARYHLCDGLELNEAIGKVLELDENGLLNDTWESFQPRLRSLDLGEFKCTAGYTEDDKKTIETRLRDLVKVYTQHQ